MDFDPYDIWTTSKILLKILKKQYFKICSNRKCDLIVSVLIQMACKQQEKFYWKYESTFGGLYKEL